MLDWVGVTGVLGVIGAEYVVEGAGDTAELYDDVMGREYDVELGLGSIRGGSDEEDPWPFLALALADDVGGRGDSVGVAESPSSSSSRCCSRRILLNFWM